MGDLGDDQSAGADALIWWFGTVWNSPLLREGYEIRVPVRTKCLGCNKPITESDRGAVTPCSARVWGYWEMQFGEYVYSVCSYHLSCFLEEVVGGDIGGEILHRIQGAPEPKPAPGFRGQDIQFADEADQDITPIEEEQTHEPGKGWGRGG